MLPATVVKADDSAEPLARFTVWVAAAVPSQVPFVNRLKVTEPVGVGPLPVTIALSWTTVPTYTVVPVMSVCDELWTSVDADGVPFVTVRGSHTPVDGL